MVEQQEEWHVEQCLGVAQLELRGGDDERGAGGDEQDHGNLNKHG
jgi:hypothetical protein